MRPFVRPQGNGNPFGNFDFNKIGNTFGHVMNGVSVLKQMGSFLTFLK